VRTLRARTRSRTSSAVGRALLVAGALLVAMVALAACGGGATPQPTATVTVTVTPSVTSSSAASPAVSASNSAGVSIFPKLTAVSIYLLRPIGGAQPLHGPFVAAAQRGVSPTKALAAAAMRALLAGPTKPEQAIGMTTAIPAGTTLHGVTIAGGVATVDLSSAFAAAGTKSAMTARLAEVVYTLTQFPSVEGVLFRLDDTQIASFGATGVDLTKPQTRADYESVTPPIFVDAPASFATVSGTLRVSGTADVFEATFRARVVAGSFHRTLTVTATSGSGTRGTFVFSVALPAGSASGKLTVWDASAENGAALHTVTIPLAVK